MLKLAQTFSVLRSCRNNLFFKPMPIRYSSYANSPFLEDVKITTKYSITKSEEDWKFVERILPPKVVPELTPRATYNSGFKPQGDNKKDEPYFIVRTRNHMLPVYLSIQQRGIRKLTYVRKIQGDIWLLGRQLEEFLQPMTKRPIRMQVNEFTGQIVINGDYVNAIKHWLLERNF